MTTVTAANPVQPGEQQNNGLLSGPSARAQAESRVRASRSASLAEFTGKTEPDEAAPPAKAEKAPAEPERQRPARSAEDDVEERDDEPAPAKAKPKADAAEGVDPDTARRLSKVAAAEKRSREQIAAERAEIEAARAEAARERKELEAERQELAAYRKAKERAKVDPAALLEAHGVTDPNDLDYAAKAIYAKAKADPNNREAAARMMREREVDDDRTALRRELAELRQMVQGHREEADARQRADRYVSGLQAVVKHGKYETPDGDEIAVEAPLARHAYAKDPKGTNAELCQIAVELAQETGDEPDYEDVLARFEKRQRALLTRYGIDPSSLLTTSSKKPDQEAAKKTAAKTLSNDTSAPRVPRPRSSERESRAETLRDFESGKLD